MANGSGLMSLCFPFMVLESIISKLSGESWIMAQRSTTKETETIIKNEIAGHRPAGETPCWAPSKSPSGTCFPPERRHCLHRPVL